MGLSKQLAIALTIGQWGSRVRRVVHLEVSGNPRLTRVNAPRNDSNVETWTCLQLPEHGQISGGACRAHGAKDQTESRGGGVFGTHALLPVRWNQRVGALAARELCLPPVGIIYKIRDANTGDGDKATIPILLETWTKTSILCIAVLLD